MPIATHPPEADKGDVAATLHPVAVSRLGGAAVGIVARPSGDLLPSDGHAPRLRSTGRASRPAPATPTPMRALAVEALALLRQAADPGRRPAAWSSPPFIEALERTVAQLAPIRSREALASSFARESFRVPAAAVVDVRAGSRPDATPVRLAYAVRWRQLGR